MKVRRDQVVLTLILGKDNVSPPLKLSGKPLKTSLQSSRAATIETEKKKKVIPQKSDDLNLESKM